MVLGALLAGCGPAGEASRGRLETGAQPASAEVRDRAHVPLAEAVVWKVHLTSPDPDKCIPVDTDTDGDLWSPGQLLSKVLSGLRELLQILGDGPLGCPDHPGPHPPCPR